MATQAVASRGYGWRLWALVPLLILVGAVSLLASSGDSLFELLGRNPFPGAPPRHVRAVLYDYRFSTPEERRRTGAWWVRERRGEFALGA